MGMEFWERGCQLMKKFEISTVVLLIQLCDYTENHQGTINFK